MHLHPEKKTPQPRGLRTVPVPGVLTHPPGQVDAQAGGCRGAGLGAWGEASSLAGAPPLRNWVCGCGVGCPGRGPGLGM